MNSKKPITKPPKNHNEEVKEKPKRKPTGYMLWSQEERKTISKYEVFSGKDLMRILGYRWQKLSDEDKLEWQNKANEEPMPTEKPKKPKKEPRKNIEDDG